MAELVRIRRISHSRDCGYGISRGCASLGYSAPLWSPLRVWVDVCVSYGSRPVLSCGLGSSGRRLAGCFGRLSIALVEQTTVLGPFIVTSFWSGSRGQLEVISTRRGKRIQQISAHTMSWGKFISVLFVTFFLVIAMQTTLFKSSALANSSGVLPDGTLIRHADTVISPSQTVEEVVVVGHNVTVQGRVTDNLIVINGNVYLTKTAKTGLILDIGGQVTSEPGAKVQNMVSLWFKGPFQNSLAVGSVGMLLVWALRVAVSVLLLAIPVVISFFIKPWQGVMMNSLRDSARKAGFAGLLTTVLALGLGMLFAITVIGIPIAVFVFVVYVFLGLIGLSLVSVWIGEFATRGQLDEKPKWLQSLIGATFLMAFSNIPLFGPLLLMVVWLLGNGAVSFFVMEKIREWRKLRKLQC